MARKKKVPLTQKHLQTALNTLDIIAVISFAHNKYVVDVANDFAIMNDQQLKSIYPELFDGTIRKFKNANTLKASVRRSYNTTLKSKTKKARYYKKLAKEVEQGYKKGAPARKIVFQHYKTKEYKNQYTVASYRHIKRFSFSFNNWYEVESYWNSLKQTYVSEILKKPNTITYNNKLRKLTGVFVGGKSKFNTYDNSGMLRSVNNEFGHNSNWVHIRGVKNVLVNEIDKLIEIFRIHFEKLKKSYDYWIFEHTYYFHLIYF